MEPASPPPPPSLLAPRGTAPAHERMLEPAAALPGLRRRLGRLLPWWLAGALLLGGVGVVAVSRLSSPVAAPARLPGMATAALQPTVAATDTADAARPVATRVETVAESSPAASAALTVDSPVDSPAGTAVVAAAAAPAVAAALPVAAAKPVRKSVSRARAKARPATRVARASPPRKAGAVQRADKPAAAARDTASADPDAQLIGAVMAHLERSSAASAPAARCKATPRPAGCVP